MSKDKKEQNKPKLVGIRMKVKQEHVKLVRIFAEKLTNGSIQIGNTIKVE